MPYAQFLRRLETINRRLKQEHFENWSLASFSGWIYYLLQPTGKKGSSKLALKEFQRNLGLYEPQWASSDQLAYEKQRSKDIVKLALEQWDKSFTPQRPASV